MEPAAFLRTGRSPRHSPLPSARSVRGRGRRTRPSEEGFAIHGEQALQADCECVSRRATACQIAQPRSLPAPTAQNHREPSTHRSCLACRRLMARSPAWRSPRRRCCCAPAETSAAARPTAGDARHAGGQGGTPGGNQAGQQPQRDEMHQGKPLSEHEDYSWKLTNNVMNGGRQARQLPVAEVGQGSMLMPARSVSALNGPDARQSVRTPQP